MHDPVHRNCSAGRNIIQTCLQESVQFHSSYELLIRFNTEDSEITFTVFCDDELPY